MYFKALTSYVKVVDLTAICTVVGRIRIGTANAGWAIIDRSGNWARTVFTDDSLSPEGPIFENKDRLTHTSHAGNVHTRIHAIHLIFLLISPFLMKSFVSH